MREKINRLAEGNYEYEQSRVIVTPEVLTGTMLQSRCIRQAL